MEIKDAIRLLKTKKGQPSTDYQLGEALQMAISALEKQEQTIDKSCETCKHKDRLVSEWRCCECFRASNLEDYWEPYTEEES